MTKWKHLDAQILLSSSQHTEPLGKVPWSLKELKHFGGKGQKHAREKKVTFKRHNILKTWSMSLCYRSLNSKFDPLTHYTGIFPQSFRSLPPRRRNRCPFPTKVPHKNTHFGSSPMLTCLSWVQIPVISTGIYAYTCTPWVENAEQNKSKEL